MSRRRGCTVGGKRRGAGRGRAGASGGRGRLRWARGARALRAALSHGAPAALPGGHLGLVGWWRGCRGPLVVGHVGGAGAGGTSTSGRAPSQAAPDRGQLRSARSDGAARAVGGGGPLADGRGEDGGLGGGLGLLVLLAAAQHLPEAQRLVRRRRADGGAVGALRHVQHAARVARQLGDAHLLTVRLRGRDKLRRMRVGVSAATRTIEGYFHRLGSG